MNPHQIEHFEIGVGVLGLAFVVESYSLLVALRECNREARKAGVTLKEYLLEGSDAMNAAVLMEDAVAVVGCGVGAGCLALSHVTGNPLYDSCGSIAIGISLGVVALVRIRKTFYSLLKYCLALTYLTVGTRISDEPSSQVLIRKNRDLLVGSALPVKRVDRIVGLLEADPVVYSVHDVKAVIIGADRGRFKVQTLYIAC